MQNVEQFQQLCACGCGLPVTIAYATDRAKGRIKGEPIRFIDFHYARTTRTKACGRCGGERDVLGQRWCRECRAEYMRERRPKHSELTPEQRMKANARAYLKVYVRRGIIKRQPCERCGSKRAEGHHHDYSKPLDVHWLCRRCHLGHHEAEAALIAEQAPGGALPLFPMERPYSNARALVGSGHRSQG